MLILHREPAMKLYRLNRQFRGLKRGTEFYLISESEFIGVKEYVLRTKDLRNKVSLNEKEFLRNFTLIKN